MKTKLLTFLIFLSFQMAYTANITKLPGDTTDVFTEIASSNLSEPLDTIFIDAGTGAIVLVAGTVDDGEYNWNINGGSQTYSLSFIYDYATDKLSESSRGFLVNVTRTNPDQERNFWVVYRNLPVKPSDIEGLSTVCAGTSADYSSFSMNAVEYEWVIDPAEAGTFSPDSSQVITVNWSSSFMGEATLKVRGIKEISFSEFSELFTVTVGTVPSKPIIEGDDFVKIESSQKYISDYDQVSELKWNVTPDNLASYIQEGKNLNVKFLEAGILSISAISSNECGNSDISNVIQVRIVDLPAMEKRIDDLETVNAELNTKIDEIIEDSTQAGIVYRNKIDSLIYEKQLLENQITDLSSQLDDALAANQEMTEKIAQLENEKLELEEQLDILAFQLGEALAYAEDLAGQVEQLENNIEEIQNEINALTEQFEILNGVLNNSLATIEELSIRIDELESKIAELESEKSALQEENSILNSTNEELAGQIAELESQIELLSQVYILQWDVKEVITKTFETAIGNFSISLYPNPSPGQIFIDCTEEMKKIEILDIQGQVIKKLDVNDTETSFTVNRTEMNPGTYFLHITTVKGQSTHQIIFQ